MGVSEPRALSGADGSDSETQPTETLSKAGREEETYLGFSPPPTFILSQLRAELGRAVNESVCKLAWNGTDAGER